MRKNLVSLLAVLIASVLCFVYTPIAEAFGAQALKEKYSETAAHLLSGNEPGVGSVGGEWLVIGLARAGKITARFSEAYYENAVKYVESVGSSKLHRVKSTENSKMILALSSIGKSSLDVGGFNLLEPLSDFDFVKAQGINGPIWALIALDSYNYPIPETSGKVQTTREGTVRYILDCQLEDGGWTISGKTADADMTGMALQALAPYYNRNGEVREAVDRALSLLSESQGESGGFSTWGSETPESSAQILTALTSLGINPLTDERFIKNGNTVIDSILSFGVEGGFAHSKSGGYNQLATEQAFYSLASYYRLCDGSLPLYRMKDAIVPKDIDGDGEITVLDAEVVQKYFCRLTSLTDRALSNADVNFDGYVNLEDVSMLQRYLVGIGEL